MMWLKSQCAQISRRGRKLQLAIAAEYALGATNSAFRKQFGLQGDRAMTGRLCFQEVTHLIEVERDIRESRISTSKARTLDSW